MVLEEISVGLCQVMELDVIIHIMYPTMNGGIITKDGINLMILMILLSNVLKVSTVAAVFKPAGSIVLS